MDGAEVVETGNGFGGVAELPPTEYVIDPTDGGIPTIDPATVAGETPTGEPAKRRGRPKGSRNNPGGKQTTKEVSSDLGTLLFTIHLVLSKALKVNELELDEDEAKQLGAALARVQKEFGVGVIPPKVMALVNLATVAGAIYVPRAILIGKHRAEKKRPRGSGNIVDMPAPSAMM